MSEPAAFGIVENGAVVSVRRFQPTEMGIGKDQKAIPLYAESAEEARRQAIEECACICEKSDRYRGDYFAAKIRELLK